MLWQCFHVWVTSSGSESQWLMGVEDCTLATFSSCRSNDDSDSDGLEDGNDQSATEVRRWSLMTFNGMLEEELLHVKHFWASCKHQWQTNLPVSSSDSTLQADYWRWFTRSSSGVLDLRLRTRKSFQRELDKFKYHVSITDTPASVSFIWFKFTTTHVLHIRMLVGYEKIAGAIRRCARLTRVRVPTS